MLQSTIEPLSFSIGHLEFPAQVGEIRYSSLETSLSVRDRMVGALLALPYDNLASLVDVSHVSRLAVHEVGDATPACSGTGDCCINAVEP